MRQVAVIGLGNFGFNLAKTLAEKGVQVLAIDKDEELVDEIKDMVSYAVVADALDKEAMVSLDLEHMDAVVVGLGQIDTSVLVTLFLKELNIKEIIVKATSEDHQKILEILGATLVVFPEKDVAIRTANRLVSPNVIDFLPLAPDYSIAEVKPLEEFEGKTLADIGLRSNYGLEVIAIKGGNEKVAGATKGFAFIPSPGYRIKRDDVLIVLGEDKKLESFRSYREPKK